MEQEIKIWFGGDIRLDAPFFGLSPENAKERRREAKEEFSNLLQSASDSGVSYVVFLGNLVYDKNFCFDTADFLINAFQSHPEIRFLILPAAHDRALLQDFYLSGRLPDNVMTFAEEGPVRFDFPDVSFYGALSLTPACLHGMHAATDGRLQVLLGYDQSPSPELLAATAAFSADVTVLGGAEAAEGHVLREAPLAFSQGFAVGMAEKECGFGSFTSLSGIEEGDSYRFSIDTVPYARRCYRQESLDLTGARTAADVSSRIDELAGGIPRAEDTYLILTLTGSIPADMLLPLQPECTLLYALKTVDDTLPTGEADTLAREMSVRGELYRSLYSGFTAEEAEDRRTIIEAFRLGLAAIDDRDHE